MDNILKSAFYKNAASEAEQVAGNRKKSLSLVEKAQKRLESIASLPGTLKDIWGDLKVFFRLLLAYYRGTYRQISVATIIKMLTAIIYFLFIVDFVPDFIPLFGFLDDIAVFSWVLKSVKSDLEKFKKWEEQQTIA